MVDFLYSGKISCDDQKLCSQACEYLNVVFGFPIIIKDDGESKSIRTDKQRTILPTKALQIAKDQNSQIKNDDHFMVRFLVDWLVFRMTEYNINLGT